VRAIRPLWACTALALACLIVASTARAAFPAPARSSDGMVATAHPLATAAALTILEDGGNAVDAAIAAAFAIGVVEPFSAGIGGGGFAVVHLEARDGKPQQTLALDFRETAPAGATRDMYLDPVSKAVREGASINGHLSVAVPGTVAGLAELHARHGSLPWRRLLRPAIDLARDGYSVSEHFARSFEFRKDAMTRFPSTRAVFMKKGGAGDEVPLVPGDRLRQRDLARTLGEIARDARSFYEGRVAAAIDAEMKAGGGRLTREDLRAYRPQWRTPLCGDYQALRLCTMPPPSSGGVHLLEILNLLDGTDLGALGWHHVDGLHRLVESMRIAYADRAVHLGDPAFTTVPVDVLTSKAYADVRRHEISSAKARKSTDVKAASPSLLAQLGAPPVESNDTSHLTVVDAWRNAVSLTFTVNYGFGSGLVAPGTGVLLNDEMDDFAVAPGVPNSYGLVGGEANAVQAGKIPLSSMTPLIATKEGRFFISAGAPGGSTIITTVLQTVINVVDFGMDAQAAIAAPRIHHQWLPDATRIERFGLDDATKKALEGRGHVFQVVDGGWGNAMCIVDSNGVLEGGADPRGEGEARGPYLVARAQRRGAEPDRRLPPH
jgi:gamma-glutamyltranspeptidase/glutathione hydrolase